LGKQPPPFGGERKDRNEKGREGRLKGEVWRSAKMKLREPCYTGERGRKALTCGNKKVPGHKKGWPATGGKAGRKKSGHAVKVRKPNSLWEKDHKTRGRRKV